MKIAILLVCCLINSTFSFRSEKFTKVENLESFKQISDILANPQHFYWYIKLTKSGTNYQDFCVGLVQEMTKITSISEMNIFIKIFREVLCNVEREIVKNTFEKVKDTENNISDASHIFRNMIVSAYSMEDIEKGGCRLFMPYIFKDSAKTRLTHNGKEPLSHHKTAVVIRDLFDCSKILSPFLDLVTNICKQAIKELTLLTKHQAAWPTEDTLYDTMDILISILMVDRKLLTDVELSKILRFITVNLSENLTLREKNKWNELIDSLNAAKIQTLEVSEVFNFNTCEDTCFMPIVGLPLDSKVRTTINGKTKFLNLYRTNIMMSDIEELKTLKELTIEILHEEFFLFPSKLTIKIQSENKMTLVRMTTSSQSSSIDLMDSDENDCSEIGLTGNESTFLHVGFRQKNHENFAFVYLEPHNAELENSAFIHAEYRDEEKLYVASLDFSDYETIRPNSGTYNIWISLGGVKKQCGQITLGFANLEKTKKESITKAYSNELTNIPTFVVHGERFYISGLYFTVVAVLIGVAVFVLTAKLSVEIEEEKTTTFWHICFYGTLLFHVLTLVYMLVNYQILDKPYVPLGQFGVLTYLFAKAFLKE